MSQPSRRFLVVLAVPFLVAQLGLAESITRPAGGQRDPSAPEGTDPNDQEAPTIQVGGKKQKKQKKKEQKLTAEQKKRQEIEASGRTALQWYDQAVGLYRNGKYLDSRAILLPLEDSARALDIQEQVKLLIADSYFAQGGALNLAEALARYKSFSTYFPTSEHAEYVQFQIARSYYKQLAPSDRDQSFTDNVIAEYDRFLQLYPESERVEQAKKEKAEALVLRARSEFEVAKFYWEWNDYRGAATRLTTVLRDWPELPEREHAIYMCAQSHYNIGERALGDSYAARLAADYPASEWTGKLDAGAMGGRTIEQQVQRQQKADKQSIRTQSRMARQDRKRTKQIRKDSGLPANVPMDSAAPAVAASAATTGDAAPAAAPTPEQNAQAAEAERRDKERIEKLEAEDAQKAARQAEEQKKAEARQAEADAKAADKAAKEEAKRAAMSEEEKAAADAKEAKALAEEKARAEKLEAEEAAKAAKEAEQQKKREEEEAAKAAKKAEKKAKKKG